MLVACYVSAWQRRSSINEKKDPLAIRDAKEEALRLQEAISAAHEERDDHHNNSETNDNVDDLRSASKNAADDVATSTPQKQPTDDSTSPLHVVVDHAIATSPDLEDGENPEKVETPTSPTPRSSVFSKRAGVTPSTPPIKESRSKKSPPISEERPKRKGCCVIF